MNDFSPGQRWISDTELHLGLGLVTAVEQRSVTLLFPAIGESRRYARQTAPLTRIRFAPGDEVIDENGRTLRVEHVSEAGGLLVYAGQRGDGTREELPETRLNHAMQMNRPLDRLLSGQIDSDKWFELRYQTRLQMHRLSHSDLRGLGGGRTSLIPHQLYIAHEVASRFAPRVLLADEVGLGKTIEAGLILHQQLLTERARRVLLVVPETLVHQWLVEMLRRFNLSFSIFDEERCAAAEESTAQDNPFHTAQLVLVSLGFLVGQPHRFRQALTGNWDLLVVDEAHHLEWSPEHASPGYRLVEQLSAVTRGVLLLTATPEQLGKTGHFARLRLLDPERFPDFETFLEEEKSYAPVADVVEALLNEQPLDEAAWSLLDGTVAEGDNQAHIDTLRDDRADPAIRDRAREALLEHLLDRHGTGRVLFRNTRATVKGFPARQVIYCPLALPEPYAECLADFQGTGVDDPRYLLCPELLYQNTAHAGRRHWTSVDPRLPWLASTLKQLRPHKVLLITATAGTALDIATALRQQEGIHAAVFHEGLSIIERDRAAAFFADPEGGCQVLICSEIGSEGRNFQFAHHLVLFDLPLNPDLLEQRIGRLDRIGQTDTIRIHVPCLERSPQALLFRWYHEGLSVFEQTCPAGHAVYTAMEDMLLEALHQYEDGLEDLSLLIDTTRQLHEQLNTELQQGQDRLLEYNSFRPRLAHALQRGIEEEDAASVLASYMEAVCDCYGIDMEEHSEASFVLQPGEHMHAAFPGLPEDGMTITFDRATALAFEDRQFLTWDHPLVISAMDMVLGSEQGNTALTAIRYPGCAPGTLLLECQYVLEAASSEVLQAGRYLPSTTIRILLDQQGQDHDGRLSHQAITQARLGVDTETARQIVASQAAALRELADRCETRAASRAPQILAEAHTVTARSLQTEIQRLKALQQINPNVRDEEIRYYEELWHRLDQALDDTRLRLDALRVVIAT